MRHPYKKEEKLKGGLSKKENKLLDDLIEGKLKLEPLKKAKKN